MKHPLLSLNRERPDRRFETLPDWGQMMFRHLHAKGLLFEVYSPISNFGAGSWECMKQPSPTVFHKGRFYRLYSPCGTRAYLGLSHLTKNTPINLGAIQPLDNKIAIGIDGKVAYAMQLTVA